ncbi:EthD family reductase [Sinomonas atrocyanea]|jgi:uncharacterized protein (TIGR02118 family)|uniref:EthD family reductase n=1 Tax=Sinomonas atrocyanea TaxID=37927 RepID=UPI00277D8270|nr:EthD family reductase [Sinomonas atrocyanea]MDQ0259590.1 uncharacterized protein (TIGR02118 family) [Sinomonas atrocyanea]MDR6623152.1 uncharacterized protein (TIGR02118 family) [Sinomonas atrocyanea]
MHKLLVLYPEPADRQAFADYYESTHLPLIAKIPGILGYRYSLDVSPGPDGAPYFAVFECDFANIDVFRQAMASPEGQAVGADVPNYATGGAVLLDYSVAEGSAARTG